MHLSQREPQHIVSELSHLRYRAWEMCRPLIVCVEQHRAGIGTTIVYWRTSCLRGANWARAILKQKSSKTFSGKPFLWAKNLVQFLSFDPNKRYWNQSWGQKATGHGQIVSDLETEDGHTCNDQTFIDLFILWEEKRPPNICCFMLRSQTRVASLSDFEPEKP